MTADDIRHDEQIIAQAIYYYPDDRDFCISLNRLDPKMLTNKVAKRLFAAWNSLVLKESPMSTIAVQEEYRIRHEGKMDALSEMVRDDSSSIPVIFSQVFDRAIERTIARSKMPAFRDALDSFGNGLISQQELAAIIGIGSSDTRLEETMTLTEAHAKILREGERERVHTGFRRLDHCVHGLPRGRVSVLAARPGVGKTDIALSMALNVTRSWKRVFFASLEMDAHELDLRVRNNIGHEADTIGDNLIIDCAGSQTVPRIAAQVMFYKPDLVVVDHLQILRATEPHRDLYTKTSEISNQLRTAAKGVSGNLANPAAWLVLSQLSRNTRTEQDKPTLSDLRDSGAIEQDADTVMFLHEPNKRDMDGQRDVQLTIAKNRSGATGYFTLSFDPRHSRWTEL